MTDYHPLIARAVDGLSRNTGEARRALYERARAALVAQLRAVEPALSESDITKERLALEEAIRKVESEAARKALLEPRTSARAEPRPELRGPAMGSRAPTTESKPQTPASLAMILRRERLSPAADELPGAESAEAQQAVSAPTPKLQAEPVEAPQPAAKPSARSRILEARTSPLTQKGFKGFRSVVSEVDGLGTATAKPAPTLRETREPYTPVSRQRSPQPESFSPPPALPEPLDAGYGDEEWQPEEDDSPRLRSIEPSYDFHDEEPIAPRSARPYVSHPPESEESYEEPHPPRSYRGWAKVALLLILAFGVAATVWEYRGNIANLYHSITQLKPIPPKPAPNPSPVNKFPGRVPQEQAPGTAPSSPGSPSAQQQTPAVAQRAVLYEADQNDPQGKRFPGSVVWRTETVSPGPGLAPELVVRADITIPERHMTVTWSLRRNSDKALPASHTIEIMFNLPPDFPGGGIANVPGILMKDSEEVRGMPLAGLAVKVTNGFFLIGLNAADADMQRNIQLLKERSWFDVLIVYNNGSRAILTMEKGPPGERAFADAFAAWGQ